MKKSHILIAVAMLAALSMTSCKNNKKNQNQEPTQEEIQAQKQALADSVLAKIDAFAEEYFYAEDHSFSIFYFDLTEAEKMVKPDYLLDPAEANKFVTKSQKVNALAIYLTDLCIRSLYDMPVDETKEAIARLAADINYPLDYDIQRYKDKPTSERVKEEYARCKEDGDLSYFWQFQNAIWTEISYIIANNPDLVFCRVTEEQYKAFYSVKDALYNTIKILAEYDDEMNEILQFKEKMVTSHSPEDYKAKWGTPEAARQTYAANKDNFVARRNALLQ